VWSIGSHRPLSSASGNHARGKPSTSKAHGKKWKVKFPCNLCEGNHPIHLFPLMDEASKELENLAASQPHLPASYRKLSPDPLLIDQKSCLVNPTLSKSESREFILDQSLVEKMVDLAPPSVNRTFSIESEPHIAQVLLVSSVLNDLEVNPLVPRCMRAFLVFPSSKKSNLMFLQHPLRVF